MPVYDDEAFRQTKAKWRARVVAQDAARIDGLITALSNVAALQVTGVAPEDQAMLEAKAQAWMQFELAVRDVMSDFELAYRDMS